VDLDDRVRDDLPVNLPYDGLVAEAYDVWLPVDGRYEDPPWYERAIREGDGPALELGCGNGRLLIGYVAAGLDVEGVDSSADMLAVCQANAAARGLTLTTHLADWTTLALARRYATVYNPAGSFSLIDDLDRARAALTAWAAHLRPGGRLIVTAGVPPPDPAGDWVWRLRRSATRDADGLTFTVHEAVRLDPEHQLQHVLHRHEVWAPDGSLVATFLRRHRLRWWTRAQLEAELRAVGLVEVRTLGDDDGFLALGAARD
jgi:SAM-dependent methyltransferase